jgi:serine/threonine-protein kinase RsbW
VKTTRKFPNDPQSVPAARRFAMGFLSGASADTLEAVELMVSELATNCVRHTDSGFELTIARTGHDIRVEATDGAGGQPTMRSPQPTEPSGRGLKIIDMLSQAWGVEHHSAKGKTVWFTVADAAPSPAGRASRAYIPTAYPARKRRSTAAPGASAQSGLPRDPSARAWDGCEGHGRREGRARPASRRRLAGVSRATRFTRRAGSA